MRVRHLDTAEFCELSRSPVGVNELDLDGQCIVIDLDSSDAGSVPPQDVAVRAEALPMIIVGLTAGGRLWDGVCDLLLEPGSPDLETVLTCTSNTPIAATALAMLMRGATRRTVAEGVHAESSVYSLLQGGPEFADWRQRNPARPSTDDAPAVVAEREDNRLDITLDRPEVRNAYNARMREDLLAALAVAASDSTIDAIHLRGNGPAFCSGGDLSEFGTRPDPATAHIVRLARSTAFELHRLADRTTAYIHGACIGSGIELPAFAGHVIAAPDMFAKLPEVGMGLIPGAGGTVSLSRRIGRHRTLLMALSQERIDAPTALDWGLVDAIQP